MKKKNIFTILEKGVLTHILKQLNIGLIWNPENKQYEHNGDIVICLDRSEYGALHSAKKKIEL